MPATSADPADLVLVFAGPVWRVSLLEGRLASAGIPCFVPDRMMKTIDPFVTGGSALDLQLLVPSELLEEAREMVEAFAAEERPAPGPAPTASPAESRSLEVWRLGRRLRWASLFGALGPIALWLAPRYLREARSLPEPPRSHRLTLAAIPVAAAFTLLEAFLILTHAP